MQGCLKLIVCFCILARVAFVMTQTKTQGADCSGFPELRPFFGLKIRSVGAEKYAFKVFHCILESAFMAKQFSNEWELRSNFPA